MLHLLHLSPGGQRHLVVAHLLGRAEQHGAQAVKRVAGSGARHHGTEAADGEHRRRRGADDAQTAPGTVG